MQLFNAFNAREPGLKSIFPTLGSNKLMLAVMAVTFGLQIIITQLGGAVFNTVPLGVTDWLKIVLAALTVVLFTEFYKLLLRPVRKRMRRKDRFAAKA